MLHKSWQSVQIWISLKEHKRSKNGNRARFSQRVRFVITCFVCAYGFDRKAELQDMFELEEALTKQAATRQLEYAKTFKLQAAKNLLQKIEKVHIISLFVAG